MLAFPMLLSLAAALLDDRAAARRALAGAIAAALAVASLAVAGGDDWSSAALPQSFLATTAALLLLAACLTVAGGAARWRHQPFAALVLGAALLLAPVIAMPLATAGGVARTIVAFGVIASATILLGIVVWKLGHPALGRLDDWWNRRAAAAPRAPHQPRATSLSMLAAHLALTLIALSVHQLHLLFAAVVAGVVTGWMYERRATGGGQWGVGLAVSLLALVAAWYLLAAVAGDAPLALTALTDAPYSDSFELLLTPILLLAVWPLLHLAPFQSARQGPAAPVLGAVLLYRLEPTAIPGGVEHWRPAIFLLLLLAAIIAVVRRNDIALITALGAAGIVSLAPEAGLAGLGLVVVGCVLAAAARLLAAGFRLRGIGRPLATLVPVAGVALLVPVLVGMLGVEVVYSVALVMVTMVAIGR